MKIITILGSPDKHGKTASVLKQVEESIAAIYKVERINLPEERIYSYLGGNVCLGASATPKDDEIDEILDRLLSADVVIYATPLYIWDFYSPIKALLNRQYSANKWQDCRHFRRLYANDRVALLATCGGAVDRDADFIQLLFDRAMAISGTQAIDKDVVPHGTTSHCLSDKLASAARNIFEDIMSIQTRESDQFCVWRA